MKKRLSAAVLSIFVAASAALAQQTVIRTPVQNPPYDGKHSQIETHPSKGQTGNEEEWYAKNGSLASWVDSQGIIHPTGPSSSNWVFASDFPGSSTDAQAQAACVSLAGNPGVIVIPSTMTSGNLTAPANNCEYWDLRESFQIVSNRPAGGQPGLSVFMLGSTIGYYNSPTDNVAFYALIDDGDWRSRIWAGNTGATVNGNNHFGEGFESDITLNGTGDAGYGISTASGGIIPPTAAFFADALPYAAGFQNLLQGYALTGSAIYIGSGFGPFHITQAVTGS